MADEEQRPIGYSAEPAKPDTGQAWTLTIVSAFCAAVLPTLIAGLQAVRLRSVLSWVVSHIVTRPHGDIIFWALVTLIFLAPPVTGTILGRLAMRPLRQQKRYSIVLICSEGAFMLNLLELLGLAQSAASIAIHGWPR